MRCLLLGLMLLMTCAARAETLLRSPWDVAPRRVISAAYACPTLAKLPRDIVLDDYYADAQHSQIDPGRYAAYQAAQAPFLQALHETEKAADLFQRVGSRAAARCVIDLLLEDEAAGAMTGRMSSGEAIYVQGWTLGGLSIAYLKARSAGTASLGETAAIVRWLVQVADSGRRYMDQRRAQPKITDARNNHAAWMGLSVMAVGVANNDDVLFDWGADRFRDQAAQVLPDGTLPLEMARGRRALHYHLFAAAPLVEMAEFGAANGVDLYAVSGFAVRRLVERCLAGLEDGSLFARQAGAAQDTPEVGQPVSAELAWAWPYARRFPGTALDAMGRAALFRPTLYLGGLPPP